MYHRSVPIADILWRMRLRQVVTLEHYLQEAAASNLLLQLDTTVKRRLEICAAMMPHVALSLSSPAAHFQ